MGIVSGGANNKFSWLQALLQKVMCHVWWQARDGVAPIIESTPAVIAGECEIHDVQQPRSGPRIPVELLLSLPSSTSNSCSSSSGAVLGLSGACLCEWLFVCREWMWIVSAHCYIEPPRKNQRKWNRLLMPKPTSSVDWRSYLGRSPTRRLSIPVNLADLDEVRWGSTRRASNQDQPGHIIIGI